MEAGGQREGEGGRSRDGNRESLFFRGCRGREGSAFQVSRREDLFAVVVPPPPPPPRPPKVWFSERPPRRRQPSGAVAAAPGRRPMASP